MKNTSRITRSTNTTKNNFTPISNNLIQNENLSLEAIGLVCFIVSLPESWIIYKMQIQAALKMNRTKFDRIWKECVDAGYIKCTKIRTNNGQWRYDYEVSDNLSVVGLPSAGLPNDGLSTVGKPYTKEKIHQQKIHGEKIHLEKIDKKSTSNKLLSYEANQTPGFYQIFQNGGDTREYLNS
jgi:hypothetical protein